MIITSDFELNGGHAEWERWGNMEDVGKAVWLLVLHRLSKMLPHLIAFFYVPNVTFSSS